MLSPLDSLIMPQNITVKNPQLSFGHKQPPFTLSLSLVMLLHLTPSEAALSQARHCTQDVPIPLDRNRTLSYLLHRNPHRGHQPWRERSFPLSTARLGLSRMNGWAANSVPCVSQTVDGCGGQSLLGSSIKLQRYVFSWCL